MKTRELIRLLQDADPSGDIECCVGNHDIVSVGVEPAYHDGCLQVLVRDPAKTGICCDIIGARRTSKGQKLVIYDLGIHDVLLDQPDLLIEYETAYTARYRERDDARREEVRRNSIEARLQELTTPS
jgi:hypothetical protein